MRILQVDGATVSEFMNFAALAYRSLIFSISAKNYRVSGCNLVNV